MKVEEEKENCWRIVCIFTIVNQQMQAKVALTMELKIGLKHFKETVNKQLCKYKRREQHTH